MDRTVRPARAFWVFVLTASCAFAAGPTPSLPDGNGKLPPGFAANQGLSENLASSSSADLTISTLNVLSVAPGTNITYFITPNNLGPGTAQSVVITDILPAQSTFVSCNSDAGGICAHNGNTVTISFPTLAHSAYITLVAQVGSEIPGGTVISNTSTIASATSDPNSSNNSSLVNTVVRYAADLSIQKTIVTSPASGELKYLIAVTAPSSAHGVVVTDPLPSGTNFVQVTTSQGSCTAPAVGANGTVTCALETMPAKTSASIFVTVKVTASPGTILSNTATVKALTFDPNQANNSSTVATTVSETVPDVTTYHYDNTRQGLNAQETTLTLANVNATKFGKLGIYPVDGKVDAQPLFVHALPLKSGATDVLYVATEHDSVFALNAATGAQIWKISLLGATETTSDIRNCGQIVPEIGITSTPVIDRTHGPNGTIFVVGMSKDAKGGYHQRLHAIDLVTGAELSTSPTEVQATYPGTGANSKDGSVSFDPGQYAERASLLLLNGNVYTSWTSHCDSPPYTGWVMAYSESTLQQTAVLNLTPNGSEGSVWMSGYGLAADTSGNIYLLDANGTFDTALDANGFPSQNDYGNTMLKLNTNGGKLAVSDYFAPFDTVMQSNADVDFGSGGAMLLPDLIDKSGTVRHLLVGAGKDTHIYVGDRDNLGKFNQKSQDNSNLYQEILKGLSNGAWSGPAYFNGTVYYGGNTDVLKAFTITNAMLSATPASRSATVFAYPGATPSVSANGTQDGIVWAVESNANSPGVLHAYNASNLANELYNSNQAANGRDSFGNGNKFITPMVVNGHVYVGTQTGVAVFGELSQTIP